MVKEAISRWHVPITVGTLVTVVLFVGSTMWTASARNSQLQGAIDVNSAAIKDMRQDLHECQLENRTFENTLVKQGSDLRYIKETLQEIKRYMMADAKRNK